MEIECDHHGSQKYLGKDMYTHDDHLFNLFNISYYFISNDEGSLKTQLLFEMHLNLQQSPNNFAFYCFVKLAKTKDKYYLISNNSNRSHKEFFFLCFEGNCYIFDLDNSHFKDNFLFLLKVHKELLLIGSSNYDVSQFMKIFEVKNGIFLDKKNENQINKIIIICEQNLINEIEIELNSIMNSSLFCGMKNELQHKKQNITDIIKLISLRIIFTYSIRRFYFPMKLFEDPSFFGNEKEFYETTKKHYNSISNVIEKYKPQKIHQMSKMNKEDFIFLRSLGKGSFASIFLAFYTKNGQLTVIKHFSSSESFEKEKKNYSQIQFYHPNVIKCYGYFENSLILEFMCNGTLQDLIEMKQISNSIFNHWVSPIFLCTSHHHFNNFLFNFFSNEVNKMKIIIEIIFGLNFLHLNDIIYCDFKPDNIFIDHNLMIHLGDFNLSCSNEFLASNTKKMKDIGTYEYFSPDVFLNDDDDYSYSSDIFQVGLIIYSICTGKKLFENVTKIESISHLNKIIKNKFIKFTYGPFCSFFYRCLKFNPINRIRSFEIINELSDFHLFFKKMMNKSTYDFYYSDILQEIQFLCQNYYEILFGFVHLFNEKIETNKAINISQLEIVINSLFQIPSLKNFLNEVSEEILTVIEYIENQFKNICQFKTDDNYNYEQIKVSKYRLLPTLYLVYSSKNFKYYDLQKASNILLSSAKYSQSLSQFLLAMKFFDGDEFFQKNLSYSILYFTSAANTGNEKSQYYLGEIYSLLYETKERITIPQLKINTNDKNFFREQALKYYKLAKKQNSAQALYGLSVLYFNGECGIKIDRKKAIRYLMLSKRQFHKHSISNFLKLYTMNQIDYDELQFEREASFLVESFNNVDAQIRLGMFYSQKVGKIELAKKYLTLASEQNNGFAFTLLEDIYLKESVQYKSDELGKKSFHCFLKAANLNEPSALFYVGCRYFFGDRPYIGKDQVKGLNYIQRASSLNNPNSFIFLGYIYFKGMRPFIHSNITKSIYYFQLAAENDSLKKKRAMDILGLIHLEGQIVNRDIQKALNFFINAKNLKSDVSTHQLGFLYEIGEKSLDDMVFIGKTNSYNPFNMYALNFSYIENLNSDFLNDSDSKFLKRIPYRSIQYYQECFSPPSLYNLAAIYYKGACVERNVFMAIDLLKKCACNYLNFASYFLYLIFSKGEKDLINKDEEQARYYLEMSEMSPFNYDLTIEVLCNSRYFYQLVYDDEILKKRVNKLKNIDVNFYDGLLKPESDISIEFDDEYYKKINDETK